MSRPATTVPEPSGRPVPSGAIATPKSRICSGVAGCPTPYFGDCSTSIVAADNTAKLSFHIRHHPIGLHFPVLDAVKVISGVRSARGDQGFARRLHVSAFIDSTRRNHRFAAVKTPGQTEAGKRHRKPWLLQSRFHPTPPSVGCNVDTLDLPTPGPRQTCQFIKTWTR